MSTTSSESVAQGPGEFLRQTRLRLGIEPDNVAQILHLSITQIAALEENRFDSLPGATYVRGYLRSYCQLLDVDSAPVLKAFEDATGAWKTTTYSNLVTERQVTSRDSIVRIATYGIAVIVVGLALVWWFGKGNQSPTQQLSEAPPATSTPGQPEVATETGSNPAPATGSITLAPTEGAKAPEPAAKPASTNSTAKPTAPPVTAAKAPAAQATPAKPPKAQASQPVAAVPAVKPVHKPRPVRTVAGDRSHLVLATSAPSWVDIRDGNNTRLLYETVAADRTISVEGAPPFQIFIGNADAVTLSYDGKTIDVQSHRNGPTARFTVGATAVDNKVAD